MKEVFTKSFWQGVKKTFQNALEGRPPNENAVPTLAAETPKEPSPADAPRSSKTSEEN